MLADRLRHFLGRPKARSIVFCETQWPRTTGCSEIVGTSSVSVLAALLSQHNVRLSGRPNVVLVPTLADAQALEMALTFFSPPGEVRILPPFDVGIYSGLYPNRRIVSERLAWLWHASRAKPGDLFVAPVDAAVQKTVPFSVLHQSSFALTKNEPIPENLSVRLQHIGYSSVPIVEDVGTFAFRGGILDIFSPASPKPVRFELFGDIVETIRAFDPESQRSGDELQRLDVIPAQEILFSDENRARAAQLFKAAAEGRDLNREDLQYWLQNLSQGQYQHGMEFLLSYFYEACQIVPLAHFGESDTRFGSWMRMSISREYDELVRVHQDEFVSSDHQPIRPQFSGKSSAHFESIEAAAGVSLRFG